MRRNRQRSIPHFLPVTFLHITKIDSQIYSGRISTYYLIQKMFVYERKRVGFISSEIKDEFDIKINTRL